MRRPYPGCCGPTTRGRAAGWCCSSRTSRAETQRYPGGIYEELGRTLVALADLSNLLTPSPLPLGGVVGHASEWRVVGGRYWLRLVEERPAGFDSWSERSPAMETQQETRELPAADAGTSEDEKPGPLRERLRRAYRVRVILTAPFIVAAPVFGSHSARRTPLRPGHSQLPMLGPSS